VRWVGSKYIPVTTTEKLPRISPVLMLSQEYSLFLHIAQTMVLMEGGLGQLPLLLLGIRVGERMKSCRIR
jgi:hypothetical protein